MRIKKGKSVVCIDNQERKGGRRHNTLRVAMPLGPRAPGERVKDSGKSGVKILIVCLR